MGSLAWARDSLAGSKFTILKALGNKLFLKGHYTRCLYPRLSCLWRAWWLYFFSFCVPLAKNVFRVSSLDPSHGQSHTLHVNDVYHKQQWLNCLRSAMTQQQGAPPNIQQGEAVRAKRRSSTISATYGDETDENCRPVSGPKLRPQTLSKTRLDQKLQGSLKRKQTGV